MIVACHIYSISDIIFDTFLEKLVKNLLAGATLHFVFISGFLFYHVFYKNFNFKIFIKGRVKRVFIPYLILSIVPIAYVLTHDPGYWYNDTINTFSVADYLNSVFKFAVSGAHITAYWYIPFAMLLFLTVQFQLEFLSLKLFYQILILSVLCLVAIFIHRPYERVDVYQALHSYFYFIPMYLFGMLCSKHKSLIYKKFKKKETLLILIVLILAATQVFVGALGLYKSKLSELNGVIDLVFIQKIFMCLFFMVYLNRFEQKRNVLSTVIATISFSIYFLHVYVIRGLYIIKENLGLSFEYPWAMFMILIVFIVMVCFVIISILEKLFPRYAFVLLGYKKLIKIIKF